MRIAFILPSLANRGPIIVIRDIVNSLVDKVSLVNVYYFDDIIELDFQAETRRINFLEKFDFTMYEIIHSHGIRPDAYVRLNRKRIPGKCVSTMHNYIKEDLSDKYNWVIASVFSRIWCRLLSKHDKIVALSRDMMEYYSSLLTNSKLTYIYNGRGEIHEVKSINEGDDKRISCFRKGLCIIGAACLLFKHKGLEHVIEYLESNTEYGFLVIGDGPEKKNLLYLAKKLNVSERCLFLGYRQNATRYFQYFDIYAIPSRSEGFPLALIEAASFKKPVICSDIKVFREIFGDDEVAFFHLDDNESFSLSMESLRKNMDTFSKNIYKKYRKAYTVKIMAKNYLKLYESLLD